MAGCTCDTHANFTGFIGSSYASKKHLIFLVPHRHTGTQSSRYRRRAEFVENRPFPPSDCVTHMQPNSRVVLQYQCPLLAAYNVQISKKIKQTRITRNILDLPTLMSNFNHIYANVNIVIILVKDTNYINMYRKRTFLDLEITHKTIKFSLKF